MKKQILTDNETKAFLIKTFGCTRQAVWQALNFERNSELARKIRTLALKRGGKLTEGYIPDCETSFNESEGTMDVTFGERVKIIVHRDTDAVEVLVDGDVKDSYEKLSVFDFTQLQHEVEQMAATI